MMQKKFILTLLLSKITARHYLVEIVGNTGLRSHWLTFYSTPLSLVESYRALKYFHILKNISKMLSDWNDSDKGASHGDYFGGDGRADYSGGI